MELWSQLNAGSISMDEYVARIPSSKMNPYLFQDTFDRLRLFAETFYFVAWRLRQVLNSQPPRHFPHITRLSTPALVKVRNHLLEHPEHGKAHARYEQHFMLTDSGLVLKTSEVLIRDGKTMAATVHEDQGLYRNAEELHEELTRSISSAIDTIGSKGQE
jgi:hypothetical protein